MSVVIYTILSPSGKVYVGQTTNLPVRLKKYRNLNCVAQAKLYASFVKYSWKEHSFKVRLVLADNTLQLTIDFWEQYLMDCYRSQGVELLNIREGGSRGRHSKETKLKNSRVLTGRKLTEEHKENIRLGTVGRKKSPEAIARTALGNTGKKRSPEICKKFSESHIGLQAGDKHPLWGRPRSEETKQKISRTKKLRNELKQTSHGSCF